MTAEGAAGPARSSSTVRRRRLLLASAVGIGGFAGACAVSSAIVDRSAGGRTYAVADVPARAVAIVPGAGVFPDGTPSPILEDRLACARDLLRAGKVQDVLVSGDHEARSYDETGAMRRWLLAAGVPEARIKLDHSGFRTLDTMARAARVYGVQSAVICSQRVYLGRALFLARAFGIDAVGVEADARLYLGRRLAVLREVVARLAAVIDVHVIHRGPRVEG